MVVGGDGEAAGGLACQGEVARGVEHGQVGVHAVEVELVAGGVLADQTGEWGRRGRGGGGGRTDPPA